MSHFGRAGPPDIKDSYSLLVLNITFPDEFAWRQDVEFALQMLSIVNLLLIRRLPVSDIKTNFPPRSELEKAIYGPQFSSITAAHIEKNLDGFTVNKVLEKTKLFNPYQHDIFMPCLNRINALSTKILSIAGTTADDLYPLFDRYGKVVDIFIPRDRRTGDSRGFAFVRYKYADEAEKAIERLDGRNVDGRDIVVQFAKYGPNAEVIKKGRLTAEPPSSRRYRSRSPQRSSRRFNDDNKHRDYRRRSRSRDRYERHGYHEREREYRRRSPSRSISPRSRSRSRSKDATNVDRRKRSRSGSIDSLSPVRRSRSPRSLTPQQKTPDKSNLSSAKAPVPASLSPNARSESPKPPSVSPSNSGA